MQGENKGLFVCKKKMGTSTEELCSRLHKAFKEFAEAAMSLRFEDEPRYEAYQALFEPILYGLTSSEKPITIDPTLRVSHLSGCPQGLSSHPPVLIKMPSSKADRQQILGLLSAASIAHMVIAAASSS